MKKVSIIVPCFNYEKKIAKNLQKIINKITRFKINYELIVINDGSTDNTKLKILNLSSRNKKIKLITNKVNKGKSFSVILGILNSKYNHVILIDCDIPYFDSFNKIVFEMIKKKDLVIVNRRIKKSKLIKQKFTTYQKIRNIIGNFVGIFINYFLNLDIEGSDTQAGLKGFKKFKKFNSTKFYSKKYFFDLELIFHYTFRKKRIVSVPVKYRMTNNSTIKLFSVQNFYILYELIKIICILNFKKKNK